MNRNDKKKYIWNINILWTNTNYVFPAIFYELYASLLNKRLISCYISIFYYILAEWLKRCHKKFTSENDSSALDALSKETQLT